jgi:hypothetical protein
LQAACQRARFATIWNRVHRNNGNACLRERSEGREGQAPSQTCSAVILK